VSANCPRCARPLEEEQLDQLTFRCCRACKGMLMPHADLIGVLDRSWHAVPKEKAETTAFRVSEGWQDEPTFLCPDCSQTMEKYGYMGIGAIQIDRCDPCALVWLDADELQNMVLALAKTNYRSEDIYLREREESIDLGATASLPGAYPNTAWLFPDNNAMDGTRAAIVAAQILLRLLA
jgi:Zn-finger nucleic acid-binding protein